MAKPPDQMTRPELIELVRELRAGESERALRRTILELQVFREELRQQNEELIRAQRELEWSRDRYVELFDTAPVGYVTFDDKGVVEEMNLTGARMLGSEPVRLVGRPFLFLVADRDLFLEHLRRSRDERDSHPIVSELLLRRADGSTLPVEARTLPVKSVDRPLFRTTLSDLTERLQAEEERRRLELQARIAQEANEAKDRLLAVLSHELRNPLAAISAGASLLAEFQGLPERVAAAVERIRRNVAAEARLINDLLDASRLRHGKLRIDRQPVDLHAVVEDAVAALRGESPELELEVALGAENPLVEGDAMRLGQVVSNLLRNARDAVVQGGTVRIATANAQQGVALEVSDTGCGIEPGDLARIFDAFEHARTNPEERGLGLGLSISKSLVEAHGGRIHAWSAGPGRGATFEVVMPSLPAEAGVRAPPPPRDTHPVELPALRILLVDDHQDTAESLAMLLRQRGFDVVVAYSMASALDKATSGFDVLISDLGLPDGSGRELAERLAAAGPIRAIALSGYGGEADVAASRAAGFRAHLVKPVEPARLLRVIERVSAA